MIRSNPYLFSKLSFEETKMNLGEKEIRSINSNIWDLSFKLDDYFDVVFLSNLADYSNQIFPKSPNPLNLFCTDIILSIKKYPNHKGVICSAYVYDAGEKGTYKNQVDNPNVMKNIMKGLGMDYEEIQFDSIVPSKEDKFDLVALLKNNH